MNATMKYGRQDFGGRVARGLQTPKRFIFLQKNKTVIYTTHFYNFIGRSGCATWMAAVYI